MRRASTQLLPLLSVAWLVFVATPAEAHHDPLSRSEWRVHRADGAVGATIVITGQDATALAGLRDASLPPHGAPGGARDEAIRARIQDAVTRGVRVTSGGAECQARPLRVTVRRSYEVGITWRCPGALGPVVIDLTFLASLPAEHRHTFNIDLGDGQGAAGGTRRDALLSPAEHRFAWDFSPAPGASPAPPSARTDSPSSPGVALEPPPIASAPSFGQSLWLGVRHIAGGFDHLLFIVALVLLSGRTRTLVVLVSVFTVAHSFTLVAGVLGWVRLETAIVEPLIAASLVLAGVDVALHARSAGDGPGRFERYTPALVFGFGLVHGLGLAGGLSDLGLEGSALALGLFGYNLGIEVAQVTIALPLFLICRRISARPDYAAFVLRPASLVIGVCGVVWTLERVVS